MKTYEVVIDVPSKEKDWCPYSNEVVWLNSSTTTAILTARDVEQLVDKVQKHYGDVDILHISEITL